MNETVEIKIKLSSVNWEDRYPGARVYINETLIHQGLITEPTEISWSKELPDGEYKIVVEMYNKKHGDTVLQDGNIIKDVLLNIDSICIDEIDLDQLTWSKSIYYPADKDAPEFVENCVNMGWNGRWELTFSSPVYLWLLENL
jgi:hypothetical protein